MSDQEDFNIIKRDLVERVGKIESKIETLSSKVSEDLIVSKLRLNEIEKVSKNTSEILIGDGKNRGIVDRVSGVEGVFRHVYVLWTFIFAAVCEFISRHIGGVK